MKKRIGVLITVLILPCMLFFTACGSSAKIKLLEEYKAVADDFLAAEINKSPVSFTQASVTSAAQGLEDFNFKLEYSYYLDTTGTILEQTAVGIVDGDKLQGTVNYADDREDEMQYTDNNIYYWYSNQYEAWIKDSLVAENHAERLVTVIQALIEPSLYSKTTKKNEHIYELKNGSASSLPGIYGEPYNAEIKINKNFLYLTLWEHVGNIDSMLVMKFTIGGQKITIPSEVLQAINYEDLAYWHQIPETSVEEGDCEITINWQDNGAPGITGWRVKIDGQETDLPREILTYTFEDLENGCEYLIYICALNESQEGAKEMICATPRSKYSIRKIDYEIPEQGQLLLSWLAPAETGGKTIIGYEVSMVMHPNGIVLPWTETESPNKYLFTDMAEGQHYTISIRVIYDDEERGEASIIEVHYDSSKANIDK